MTLKIFDSLFPQLCPGCGKASENYFCGICSEKIIYLNNSGCQRCLEDHGPYLRPESCPSCRHNNWKLKKVLAVASYESPIREALLQLKFGGHAKGVSQLAAALHNRLNVQDFDCLVPVPNPFWRQLKRGYNQAELLSRELGKIISLPSKRALACRWRPSQLSLKAEKRRHASADFFKVIQKIKGARIALVDDIFTTGGTANACAQVLLEAGAKEVSALVVGRRRKK